MKSKFITLFGISCVLFSTSVLAWNNPYSNDSDDRYQTSSGTTYQYDMSNPVDRNRYSTDTSAQQRDRMNSGSVDSYFDNSLGQFGGGIYDD